MQDVYCAGKESTFQFLENVLSEVVELFPGEYIHIGGDEVLKNRWSNCPKCQERIKKEGLKDERELQSYFIKRIADFLLTKQKKIIGWDEILEGGLPPGATVQSWQSFKGAIDAAKKGHYSICSPASHTYLNIDPDNLDMRTCYSFNPIPDELSSEEAKFILGSEVCMWTENAPQETIDTKLFPRILALSEAFWTEIINKNFDEFYSRVQMHYDHLVKCNIQYGRESKAIIYSTTYNDNQHEFTISLKPGQSEIELFYTTNGNDPDTSSNLYSKPISVNNTTTLKISEYTKP
jgi:hexosaminidase